MTINTTTKLKTAWITAIAMLPLLVACGGGDGEQAAAPAGNVAGSNTSDNGSDQTCHLLFLFILGDVCVDNSSGSSGSSGSTDPLGGPGDIGLGDNTGGDDGTTSSGDTRRAHVNGFPEFEPNSTIDNANVMPIPVVADHVSGGVEITGSVQQDEDPADYFIITPTRSGTYLIYLCASTCTDIVVDDQVYLMVYDQNQTTIDGTPVGTFAKQQFSVELAAGMAYYVAIHGYDTGPQPYPYKLVVID